MTFEEDFVKKLTSEVIDVCFEHYSLGGATPQMKHNELGSCTTQRPACHEELLFVG